MPVEMDTFFSVTGRSGNSLLFSSVTAMIALPSVSGTCLCWWRVLGRNSGRGLRSQAGGQSACAWASLGSQPARQGDRSGPQIRACRFDDFRSAFTTIEYLVQHAFDRQSPAGPAGPRASPDSVAGYAPKLRAVTSNPVSPHAAQSAIRRCAARNDQRNAKR